MYLFVKNILFIFLLLKEFVNFKQLFQVSIIAFF